MKKLEDRKLTIYSTQKNGELNGRLNVFQYESYDETMVKVRKHDWDGYAKLSENGSSLLLEFDGYAFSESLDAYDRTHYFIVISYWDPERPDTFFKLELKTFNNLMAMCLTGNNLQLFYEELKAIEFGGATVGAITVINPLEM